MKPMNALLNALMPGEHNYMRGKPMPGQIQSSPLPEMSAQPFQAQPQAMPAQKSGFRRDRGPVMNALGGFFEFAAPEAYDAGRQRKLGKMESEALGAGKYDEAGRYRMQAGDFEGGAKIADYGQQQAATARQQEAQKLVMVMSSAAPQQLTQMAMSDPAGFEQATGQSSEEYISSMTRLMQQGGMSLEEAHAFVLKQAQAEAGMAPNAGESYTLAPGAGRYDAAGNLIASNPVAEKPVTPMSTIGKLRADFEAGRITPQEYEAELARMQRADPSLSVQFGEGGALAGITYGTATKGNDAAIVRGRDGQPLVSPGPQQEAYSKADKFLKSKTRQIGIVRDDIARARQLTSDPMATGVIAAVTKDLPFVGAVTPAGRLERRINTVKANIGFDKLDEMRQNSPTGGALGNVTEKEIYFLQSVLGDLDNAQTDEDVDYILKRVDDFYIDLENQYKEAFAADFPTLAQTAEFRAGANQQVQDLNGLYAPDGSPVTEDDIQTTMEETGMTREQIIARLGGR